MRKRGEPPGTWADQWAARAERAAARRVTVDTRGLKACKKCGSTIKPVYRHHKGFDSYVGLFNKSIRFRYKLYLDCVALCEDCHCEIHFIYVPYTEKWVNHTPAGATAFRAKLITVCDDWLSGRIPSPSVPKTFRRLFHRSLVKWRRENAKPATG